MSTRAPVRRNVERIPPRRRRVRRTAWQKTGWPLTKAAIVVIAAFLLTQAVVGRVARPLTLWNTEYRESKRVAAELESLRKENELLEQQIKYLQTPRGAAQAARKLGYVKPGERTIVLPAESAKAP